MTKHRYWEYSCDHCGNAEQFTHVNDPFDSTWIQYGGLHFCSDSCLKGWEVEQL